MTSELRAALIASALWAACWVIAQSLGRWPRQKEIAMSFKIELGAQVKDRVTGLVGICVGRSEWLYGCRRYVVQPPELKDGKPVETTCFDEDALEVVAAVAPHTVKDTGGPQPEVTRHSVQEARAS